ncbi:MAG TPA: hypothetical protein PKX16_07355, partial [Kiritimatiellia bacterium]|nr:hypothetical protein [Kiritimatiellia bacterium]
ARLLARLLQSLPVGIAEVSGDFQAGDAVSYYVTGDKKNVPVHAHARPASEFDPAARDENVPYYLAKLDALVKKLDAHAPEAKESDNGQPTLF